MSRNGQTYLVVVNKQTSTLYSAHRGTKLMLKIY